MTPGPETIPVSELFYSIQGEGSLAGVPSFFIRTSGCNLRCAWCDTPYASWNPAGGPREIGWIVARAKESGARHAVVTGGEPMMFPSVAALTEALGREGMHVTIETAGTVFRRVRADLMSISPKLANSTPREGDARDPSGAWRARHEERRLNFPALQSLIDEYAARQFKFVVTGPADLAEIESILARLAGWRAEEIMLMPEGVAAPGPGLRDWAVETCLSRGWRYAHRLHVELFGNVRGT